MRRKYSFLCPVDSEATVNGGIMKITCSFFFLSTARV